MNKIILIGNVGKDPEVTTVKTAKGDMKVAKFGLAVNEMVKGEKTTQWFNIVAWDKKAETLGQYVKKGSQLCVEGRLSVREYEKDGVKGKSVEVVASDFQFLGSKADSASSNGESAPAVAKPAATKAPAKAASKKEEMATADIPAPELDDLPF